MLWDLISVEKRLFELAKSTVENNNTKMLSKWITKVVMTYKVLIHCVQE